MPAKPSSPEIPLPRRWPSPVKSAILHVIYTAGAKPRHLVCDQGPQIRL